MILRALAVGAGMMGAIGASQFPEFSQQYMQRLGGAVDELDRQITRYAADAAEVGMTLPDYLDRLAKEGPLARTQAQNMISDMARYEQLAADLGALQGAGPFMRAKLATHLGDAQIWARARETYKPAVPATFEGATFAGTGFVAGWLGLTLIFGFLRRLVLTLRRPIRRRRV
ncbi:polyhydroxyalkanoate synthesis regulator phasin [Sagittula marina]|uniref:Polyhydroxyalkanoate synthesis regulator phasin n=1 Tax=Sagittula marina TaxID=943940 RepID=A0A7W6DT94_9RHOB|nr:DUF2937 family protein [Sagittula marina]MBB3985648.1 polyhydroxyalkanoate synthesis regulator phasin [Sagittula marina]